MPFSDIRAQDAALRVIRTALDNGRAPHAWLFAGPDGVGKGMTARVVSMALVCEVDDGDECGQCGPCVRVAAEVHPDVFTLAPKGAGRRVRIDQVREVSRSFRYAPFEGRHRTVVIPEADRLNVEAANALLKSLEEPPARTVFLLVTSQPRVLLDTIRSRCQEVRFSPLPRDLCAEFLQREGISSMEATVAAALSEGSVGRALALVGAGVLEERVATIEALEGLSITRPGTLFELASEWTAGRDAASARDAMRQRLDLLASWYRDRMVLHTGGGELVHVDLVDKLRPQDPRATLSALDCIQAARDALEVNASARLTCERLLVGLAEVRGA